MKHLHTFSIGFFCLLFFNATLFAQSVGNTAGYQPVAVTDGRDVQIFPSKDTQTEVTIIINKKNPQNLIASCNTFGAGQYHYFNQGYYSTHDGGATWVGSDYLNTVDALIVPEDPSPSLAFTTDTVAFMSTATRASGYYVSKSYNGGQSYSSVAQGSNSIYIYTQSIAIDDSPNSLYKNNFYSAWEDGRYETISFNRSTDTGHTFSNEMYLRPAGTPGFGQGTNVKTGANGEVYVCWADHTQNVSPYAADGVGFAKSLDGGVTFTPYSVIFPFQGVRTEYTDPTFNFTRTKDFPSMAVDKSNGAHRGRIYIAYPSKQTGKAVIYVRWSDDKGATWSAGKAISIPKASQSFLPAITVDDATGNVYIDYFAFDNPNVSYSTNTYVAGSTNGGTSWKNLKVSDAPHITHAIQSSSFEEGSYGNYIGIAAYNNKVYPAWMDSRTGTYQIYVSKETINTTAAAAEETAAPVIVNKTNDNKMLVSPNPFTTTLNLLLSTKDIQSVELYDRSGKLLKQWNGVSSCTLNVSDIGSGLYLLRITDKMNNIYTQKIVK